MKIAPGSLKYTQEQLSLLQFYIGELIGLKAMGKKIHQDPRSFRNQITNLGITIPFPGSIWRKFKQHIEGEFYFPLPSFIKEIIIGTLLGDGQLRLQSKNMYHLDNPSISDYKNILCKIRSIQIKARNKNPLSREDIAFWNTSLKKIQFVYTAYFRLHKSILEFEWVKFLLSEFKSFIDVQPFVKPAQNASTKWSCGFYTSSSVQFFALWKKWYYTKRSRLIKIIPNLPPLTPNILLHWYIGDGYFSGSDLSLCTHCFSLAEQRLLLNYLKTVGVKAKIREKKSRYFINISTKKENRTRFFTFMGQAKLFDQAKNLFPYKFSGSCTKREWKEKKVSNRPEYFQKGVKIREKLVVELKDIEKRK